ncbi:hypothetical protein GCM10010384_44470 [Streptomyces djakartensis]|uniref:Secreted protein n=1 Tax=Streptomyces djakartensis TaxID=68193 RepID=A0ABQ3A1J0_9ACTN|nr:hypothetical protein GCM10010384_44470 [Streptomyces djakartensis]
MVEKSRALWMCGRAMFTMVMSRTTISWHEAMTSSAIALPPPPDSLVVVPCGEAGCGLLPAVSTVRRYARPPGLTTGSPTHPVTGSSCGEENG